MAPAWTAHTPYRQAPPPYSPLGPRASVMRRQEVLGLERGHTAGAGSGNRLTVALVLYVASREHAGDAGHRRARRRDDVALLVGLELAAQERCVRHVAD